MKKYFLYIQIVLLVTTLATVLNSCSKQDGTPKNTIFAPPRWQADTTGKYPLSMTAVVQVNSFLNLVPDAKDELGAFINGECRGTGVFVNSGTQYLYSIVIRGTSSENSQVAFKYYNALTQNMYATADGSLTFVVDSSYGSPDAPKVLALHVIK